jgi:hypothetical protein
MTMQENKTACYLAIVAGVLLLVAGLSGVALMSKVQSIVQQFISDTTISFVFTILILLASLGGLLVLGGGGLLYKDKVAPGKILITIGTGAGLIGLIIMIVIWIKDMSLPTMTLSFILGLVGVILSVAARLKAKKPPKPA